jgi:2-amino-4-hydroxy-6-hydroxymethyldihydropteridine diphosphokinase
MLAKVYISIGSNVNREKNICSSIKSLRDIFGELELSSVYENGAVGFDGDNFYNLVVGFETDKSAETLPPIFRDIESRHERVRGGERFSSRTLDIDLLLYDDLVLNQQGLQIPRDEITRYAFVLRPLAELAPLLEHPVLHQSMRELWDAFEPKESMTVVDLPLAC